MGGIARIRKGEPVYNKPSLNHGVPLNIDFPSSFPPDFLPESTITPLGAVGLISGHDLPTAEIDCLDLLGFPQRPSPRRLSSGLFFFSPLAFGGVLTPVFNCPEMNGSNGSVVTRAAKIF